MDKVLMSIKQLEGYLFSLASFSDCPQPVDPLTIALPIGGSVVLAGIIAMVIWRLVQNRIDTQRYEDFMKEIKESNWTEVSYERFKFWVPQESMIVENLFFILFCKPKAERCSKVVLKELSEKVS